ncbi:MAG TPA: FAD binding domain-containing protein, partial [Dehalococcoidales bacterium]|nr:FAD binding domain-containing protein [Dehalococcoidales bacterium]
MILPRFQFLEPETFEEVHHLVEKNKGDAVLMAGGTDLLVNLKRKVIKAKVVISLEKIKSLKQVHYSESAGLTLGSMVTVSELVETPIIKQKFPLLAIAANKIGSPQIRNRATIGGNICTARPAGDTIGPLTAYGAEVQLVLGKETRWEPISKFITGPGKTTRKEGEVLAAIRIKPFPANTGVSYIKYGVRKAMEIAMVSVTTAITFNGDKCEKATIVLGAVAPTFIRSNEAEESLVSQKVTLSAAEKAAELAAGG